LENAKGFTTAGDPYLRVFLLDGVLLPGKTMVTKLDFRREYNAPQLSYTLQLHQDRALPNDLADPR